MSNPTFAQIQEEIENMLDIPDEELTVEQRRLMDEYLNELAEQEAGKVDNFAGFVKRQAGIAEAVKKEADRLAAKAKAINNKIDSLKRRYVEIMRSHGIKKVSGNVYSIGVRENAKVEVVNLDKLVQDNNPLYVKTEITYKPDKMAIKEAIKGGVEVPGCVVEKTYSLNIR